MSEPFLGQIQAFGFNFPPQGWAKCDGQLLAISQFSALFSLLGTQYGGDAQTTFGLPDLRGRTPIHTGTGPGLSTRAIGSKSGSETNTLNTSQLPAHNHPGTLNVSSNNSNQTDPTGNGFGVAREDTYISSALDNQMVNGTVTTGNTGGNQSINNMPPYLTINWCIALVGIYPSQN